MTGNRRSILALAILAVALSITATACKPKPPDAPPAALPTTRTAVPTPEPVDVTPPPRPTPTRDVAEETIPADIAEATRWAHEKGLLGEVYFAFDSSTLDQAARDRLTKNAAFLKQYPQYVVTIEGHCDERGTNEYNIALGDRRGNTASEFTASLGVPASRLRAVSYGEERPSCSESTEGCWAKNRRAYFRLTGKM